MDHRHLGTPRLRLDAVVADDLDDPAGDHDWGFDVEVDLEASDEEGAAVIRLVDAGRKD